MVLDPEHDQAVAHAAFTSADISPALVHDILNRLEETAIRMSESDNWSLPVSNGKALHTSSHSALSNGDSEGDGLPLDVVVDDDILERIREIASRFLRIDAKLITGETSLLSLGLDSIKSVGLSRQLSKEGFALSSADIMRLSTPQRLAVQVQAKASAPQDGERMVLSFKEERDKLVREMDMVAIRLSEDDEVNVFPTTTLQAGMLSQVRLCPNSTSTTRLTYPKDCQLQWTSICASLPATSEQGHGCRSPSRSLAEGSCNIRHPAHNLPFLVWPRSMGTSCALDLYVPLVRGRV